MTAGSDIASAYRACERITRSRAGNFYYGIALLPPAKRRALCAVYAMARRIDDIGDGRLAEGEKLRRLRAMRELVGGSLPAPGDPVAVALADAGRRFPIPIPAFGELVDGVVLDVLGTRYHTFSELHHYCGCVAGSIGRLSVAIFGASDPVEAAALADDLGTALQLTNILRDIVEDAAQGRCYLPLEDLARLECAPPPELGPPDTLRKVDALHDVIAFEAARAETWFVRGLGVLPLLDRRSRSCVATMAGIYHRLLARIQADPAVVLRGRLRLERREKALVAARSLAGLNP